jgi:hypothetical protein
MMRKTHQYLGEFKVCQPAPDQKRGKVMKSTYFWRKVFSMTSSVFEPPGPTTTGRLRCGRGPAPRWTSSMLGLVEVDTIEDSDDGFKVTW